MKVVFTSSAGQPVEWDGLLWRSAAVPALAQSLNEAALPPGHRHESCVERARRQVSELLGPVSHELADLTGMVAEDIGGDVVLPKMADLALADATDCAENATHDRSPEASPEGGALAAAQAHLRRSVCPDAGDAGDADGWDAPEREWRDLRDWARQRGLILKETGPLREGGREHEVRFEPETGRWLKFTKPGLAGYTVDWREDGTPFLLNALPSQYLERLRWQNGHLEDDIRLEGLVRDGQAWRIVTSQPDVPGRAPTWEELHAGLEALGLQRLRWVGIGYQTSESWRLGRLMLWDVHPSNLVLGMNGVLVPIDVILTTVPELYPPQHFHFPAP